MGEPAFGGVSLEQYVAVYAALAEGFPFEVVLEGEGLSLDAWMDADEAWNDAVAADSDAGGGLAEAIDVRTLAKQNEYRRPIPPLDEDPRAWLSFVSAWSRTEEPIAFLRHYDLGPNDLTRLHRHWSARFAAEPSLRTDALDALKGDAVEAPVPSPEPLELRPSGAVFVNESTQGLEAEEASGALEAAAAAPPFRVALPAPPVPFVREAVAPIPVRAAIAIADVNATVLDGAFTFDDDGNLVVLDAAPPPVANLPGAIPGIDTTLVPGLDANPFDAFPVPPELRDAPPADTVPPPDPRVAAELSLTQYAALCAELETMPHQAEAIFGKYGLFTAAQRSEVDRVWREKLEHQTMTFSEWRHLYQHFKEHWSAVARMQRR